MARSRTRRFLVAVVDFNHARGPELEFWLPDNNGADPARENDWNLLPFMALSDGAHAATEEFSYFTVLRKGAVGDPPTSLFGISCTRQILASRLRNKSADVTRSTVQKAVVVLTDQPQLFGHVRERLSVVTTAWFAQRDFSDIDILRKFQESLLENAFAGENDQDEFFGLSLREMVHEFKHLTLVLFKCCLLQPKMLFFASRCERLCMLQFSIITLIPGLIRNLEDCADPALDSYEQDVSKAVSLRTSDRSSLLAYMGLPLQLFGKVEYLASLQDYAPAAENVQGSFFSPYTPLQQLDLLADPGTKSYILGSTNSLLLQQKDRYSDVLINLDDTTVNITSPSLRTALSLSAADRRWIDSLTQTVADTWDASNPSMPNTLGYAGSEEFIRLQFEEYLLALLSSVAYSIHRESHPLTDISNVGRRTQSSEDSTTTEADPTQDFNPQFITAWKLTSNFTLFARLTSESRIFDIIEPRHPTAGGLSVEDVQRRLAQQVADLHLDERVREGKETLSKTLVMGRERVGQGLSRLWSDVEAMREVQRRGSKESSRTTSPVRVRSADSPIDPDLTQVTSTESTAGINADTRGWTASLRDRTTKIQTPDLTQIQQTARENTAKAATYLSGWGTWAKERGREWSEKRGGRGSVGVQGSESRTG